MADIKCLEHQTLKVPYEILNKKFRGAQKTIDREISYVQNAISTLEKKVNDSSTQNLNTIGNISELITGVVEKLYALKRKAKESFTDEIDAVTVCKRRLDHLKEYCVATSANSVTVAAAATGTQPPQQQQQQSSSANDTIISAWTRKRLDRMLVEHFLLSGFYETAIKLALQANIENLTNIDLFLVSRQVEESLARKETQACLNWCHDNKSKLRKMKSTLEFNLRQQEFIELLRSNQHLKAIKHARKYFSSIDEKPPNHHEDLQHVMGLLAFKSTTQVEPYRTLFDEIRWQELIKQFRQENYKLYQLSSTSIFTVTLQCGLSALKTPQCYKQDGQDRNPDCPVCSDVLNELARTLPCSHCSQSRLFCSISGQPLNEHNQPLMLPNGNVYGENALKEMAAKNNNKIICPRTKQVYDFKELEKVFVM